MNSNMLNRQRRTLRSMTNKQLEQVIRTGTVKRGDTKTLDDAAKMALRIMRGRTGGRL